MENGHKAILTVGAGVPSGFDELRSGLAARNRDVGLLIADNTRLLDRALAAEAELEQCKAEVSRLTHDLANERVVSGYAREVKEEVERLNKEYAHTWTDERHRAEMAEVEAERDRYKADAEEAKQALGDALNCPEIVDKDSGDAYYFMTKEFVQRIRELSS